MHIRWITQLQLQCNDAHHWDELDIIEMSFNWAVDLNYDRLKSFNQLKVSLSSGQQPSKFGR